MFVQVVEYFDFSRKDLYVLKISETPSRLQLIALSIINRTLSVELFATQIINSYSYQMGIIHCHNNTYIV